MKLNLWNYFGIAFIIIILLLLVWLVGSWVFLGIILVIAIFLILAWLFELFNNKKIADFFERIAEAIHDFFT